MTTQWFNPPYTSMIREIRNSFGVAVAIAIDVDTASGIADALNTLHKLGYDAEHQAIGSKQ